jgi:hypothetical protein
VSRPYGTLEQTVIVVLKPGDIDDRASLHGGRDIATLVARAENGVAVGDCALGWLPAPAAPGNHEDQPCHLDLLDAGPGNLVTWSSDIRGAFL